MQVLKIIESPVKNKKYRAVYSDGTKIDFGDKRYQQFYDSTPLKLYSYLNHGDKKRRDLFYKRHANNTGLAAQLSKEYLW